jgi:Zn-dependent peptidase ImmA (M78 family)
LELNLGYFQHDDAGVLQRLAHRLKVVGHQLANRPGLLVDAVKTLDLRALWVPDQKYVMIDKTQPKPKWRWLEAHEMGHKLCDWHGDFLFGDTEFSLSPACHQKLESEANYAAGQLLFLGDRFKVEATDLALGFSSIQRLKSVYQNTMTTTMWRSIRTLQPFHSISGVCGKIQQPHRYGRLQSGMPILRAPAGGAIRRSDS